VDHTGCHVDRTGCHHVDHTGCHQLVLVSISPTRVGTSAGCQNWLRGASSTGVQSASPTFIFFICSAAPGGIPGIPPPPMLAAMDCICACGSRVAQEKGGRRMTIRLVRIVAGGCGAQGGSRGRWGKRAWGVRRRAGLDAWRRRRGALQMSGREDANAPLAVRFLSSTRTKRRRRDGEKKNQKKSLQI
jgi:hypothetical protein